MDKDDELRMGQISIGYDPQYIFWFLEEPTIFLSLRTDGPHNGFNKFGKLHLMIIGWPSENLVDGIFTMAKFELKCVFESPIKKKKKKKFRKVIDFSN